MIAGLSGSLLSHEALARVLAADGPLPLPVLPPAAVRDRLRTWHAGVCRLLGPASAPRAVFDRLAEPLARALGFHVVPLGAADGFVDAGLEVDGAPVAVLITAPWGYPATAVWRHGISRAVAQGVRWCLTVNGRTLRVTDAARAYARRYAEIDLELAFEDDRTAAVFWTVFQAPTVAGRPAAASLNQLILLSEQHRSAVRASLREGVREALVCLISAFRAAMGARARPDLLHESLIVIYRILFLLFAEARALVPRWHPVYEDGYTIEALRRSLHGGGAPAGLWEALQAVARLAHRGCRAGTLRVPPFNGRLFSPADAPLADSLRLDDHMVGRAMVALTSRAGRDGREAISYADLGVEQLGAVYEHLLDYDVPSGPGAPSVLVRTGRRKATGSFYTPRSLTEFLARRTLAPLVTDASPEKILSLRVLDPAMGSGAFLVAACRFLASAYEQALIREGSLAAADIERADRAAFRRMVAQRCLFGVDVNPMAVQLGRLSLWLATLAAGKPLTFLDHHLRSGHSLVGGSVEDILRRPVPGGAPPRNRPLPLFDGGRVERAVEAAVSARKAIEGTPDDTVEQVRSKERALSAVNRPDGPLERWKAAADLWCAAWFRGEPAAGDRRTFRALLEAILQDAGSLPASVVEPLRSAAARTAAVQRFFHWPLEFPEVFFDPHGGCLPSGGFDAIVGNPPWEMLRADPGGKKATGLLSFSRGSAIYYLQGRGHGNLYQLFLERMLQLLRPGGRAGIVLPSGFATDQACAALRRHLFDRTTIDTFTTVENRTGIFPIHRGLRFLLLAFSKHGRTDTLPARQGIPSADLLDSTPDAASAADTGVVPVPRAFLECFSGQSLAVPAIRTHRDLEIASSIALTIPPSADPDGWGIHFGRELNATDDRPSFGRRGLPIVEGKQLHPFRVDVAAARHRITAARAARRLDPVRTFGRRRLGYRDVAAATNRTTLIAAIIPAGVVTTHTVFCVRERLDEEEQQFLCGVFNSYVGNYLVRLRVSTHVTTEVVARLPVPRPARGDPSFAAVVRVSRALARGGSVALEARLNAVVAGLYKLTYEQFDHVVGTFPLVPAAEREAALRQYRLGKDQA